MNLPETEIAWLAGIFDGEGSARVYRSSARRSARMRSPHYFVQVSAVSNTDPQIIERVTNDLAALGFQGKYHTRRETGNLRQKRAKPWWKACGDVRVSRMSECKKFLEIILPYLTGSKKYQAETVLSFVRLHRPRSWVGNPRSEPMPTEQRKNYEKLYQQQEFRREIRPQVLM